MLTKPSEAALSKADFAKAAPESSDLKGQTYENAVSEPFRDMRTWLCLGDVAALEATRLVPGAKVASSISVGEGTDPDVSLKIEIEDGGTRFSFSALKTSRVVLHIHIPNGLPSTPSALAVLIEAEASVRTVITPAFTIFAERKNQLARMRGCVFDKSWTMTEAAALESAESSYPSVSLTLDLMVRDLELLVKRLRVW